jgi:Flp pilus assembly protein CpaB
VPGPSPVPSLPRPSARPTLRLPRRPAPFWLASACLAALSALVAAGSLQAAVGDRERYGRPVTVVVATQGLAPGDRLVPDTAELRPVPSSLVPEGALTDEPAGQVVTATVPAGEVVVAQRVGAAALSPTAARLPPGTRGLAVPLGTGALPLHPGDRVDVVATLDDGPLHAGTPATTVVPPVATGATVVAVDETAATVAVTAEEAAGVARAVHGGAVTLLLVGAR